MHQDKTARIIQAAMRVHSTLGPGFFEGVYDACLALELSRLGMKVERQVLAPVLYDGIRIELGYRMDLLVDDAVVVELKTVSKLQPVHHAQLLAYLRMSDKRVGLLINFNVQSLKDGIKRVSN